MEQPNISPPQSDISVTKALAKKRKKKKQKERQRQKKKELADAEKQQQTNKEELINRMKKKQHALKLNRTGVDTDLRTKVQKAMQTNPALEKQLQKLMTANPKMNQQQLINAINEATQSQKYQI